MRILFLALDVDLSAQRGDSVHTIELARALQGLGHQVVMIAGAGASSAGEFPRGVEIHVAGSGWDALAIARKVLRRFPADIVYERRSTPKIGLVISYCRGIPMVMEINGVLGDELAFQGRKQKPPLGGPLAGPIRAAMFRRVRRFVAVSDGVARDLVLTYRIDASIVTVVGNGVDTDRFVPMEKREACKRVGLPTDPPRILFVGNLAPWRDLETLLRCLSSVRRHHPQAQLVIVGDGQDRLRLEESARERFPPGVAVFTGAVPHHLIPLYVGCSDICVLPARTWDVEISPLKLFEYMACGRPIVCSNVPGLEIVEAGGMGHLVPPGDADRLAAAIGDLLESKDVCSDMGRRARAFAVQERSWRGVAQKVTSVLATAVGLPAEK